MLILTWRPAICRALWAITVTEGYAIQIHKSRIEHNVVITWPFVRSFKASVVREPTLKSPCALKTLLNCAPLGYGYFRGVASHVNVWLLMELAAYGADVEQEQLGRLRRLGLCRRGRVSLERSTLLRRGRARGAPLWW